MTKDECKQLLAEKIASLGGCRADELVAWRVLYAIEGFSEVFHPDLLQQMVTEGLVKEIKYTVDTRNFSFLVPKSSKIDIIGD